MARGERSENNPNRQVSRQYVVRDNGPAVEVHPGTTRPIGTGRIRHFIGDTIREMREIREDNKFHEQRGKMLLQQDKERRDAGR